jgi:hypothetical protein
VRCKTCHYSLLNLTKHRCPECGRPFDPRDASTFDVTVRAGLWANVVIRLACIAGPIAMLLILIYRWGSIGFG